MSTYTPGPWKANEDHPESAVVRVYAIGEEWEHEVATLFGSRSSPIQANGEGMWGPDPERLANARLIAAAPELLAALVEIMTFEEYFQDSGPLESRWMSNELKAAISACESAIKKATE